MNALQSHFKATLERLPISTGRIPTQLEVCFVTGEERLYTLRDDGWDDGHSYRTDEQMIHTIFTEPGVVSVTLAQSLMGTEIGSFDDLEWVSNEIHNEEVVCRRPLIQL